MPLNALFFGLACAPRYAGAPPMAPAELSAPAEVSYVDLDGVRIAMIDEGAGRPVVLLHGLSSYMGYWEHQIPELSNDHRVLALDLPGFGMSSRPDASYTPPWFASLVVDWMDDVGLESAVFVGHSMGGQVALTLALEHPDRVDALVLAAPAGFETFTPGAADWMKSWWTESRAMHSGEEDIRATMTTMVFNRHDEGVERLIEERVRLGRHPDFGGTSVAVSRSIAGMLDHPVTDRLGEVDVPTLIVFGTDDRMIPNPVFTGGRTSTIARRGHEAIAGSDLVLINGAGHTVHHDAPTEFNQAVTRFLEEL